MPIGTPFQTSAQAAANVNGIVGGQAQAQATIGQANQDNSSVAKAPIALMAVIVLYLIWAVLIRHEKVESQLSPANVAVNIHNIIVVGLTAMLFILVGKIASTKAVAAGLPGAGYVAQLFAAA